MSDPIKAPEPRRPDGWYPIETAPMDGTHVLLYGGGNSFDGYFQGVNEYGYSGWAMGLGCSYVFVDHVTHWMPLPLAPSNEQPAPRDAAPACPVTAQELRTFASWIRVLCQHIGTRPCALCSDAAAKIERTADWLEVREAQK